MIPLPYSSDAPLYHWPIATAGLVLLNVALYCTVPFAMYLPDGHQFLEIEAQHKLRKEIEEERQQEEAELEAAVREQQAELAGVLQENPDWAADVENKEWKQRDFQKNGENVENGIGFQVVDLNRDSSTQFPDDTLALQHGKFRPRQWFTAIFMHYDPLHLIFNMIALWAFGLVVEGKVGSFVFLGLYVLIGVGQAAIEQTLMLFSSEGSGSIGSTAAILGALGIATIWAPKNEFECFWAYGFRFGMVEIPIAVYGFIILLVQLAYGLILSYLTMTAIMQLIGLPLGAIIGLAFLKIKWVDCEGWDIINVIKGNEGGANEQEEMEDHASQLIRQSLNSSQATDNKAAHPAYFSVAPTPTTAPSMPTGPQQFILANAPDASQFDGLFSSLEQATGIVSDEMSMISETINDVVALISGSQFESAYRMYQRVQLTDANQRLTQPQLDRLIRGLLAAKQYEYVVPAMHEHLSRFPVNRTSIQFALVKSLLQLGQAKKGIQVLKQIDRGSLNPTQQESFKQLAAHAKKQIDAGSSQ